MNNPNLDDLINSIDEKIRLFDNETINEDKNSIKQQLNEEKNIDSIEVYKNLSLDRLTNILKDLDNKIVTIDYEINTLKNQLYNKYFQIVDVVHLMANKVLSYKKYGTNNNLYNLQLGEEDLQLFNTYLEKSDYITIEYNFINEIKERIQLPVTEEQIFKCKNDMLNQHLNNSSKYYTIQEMWKTYEGLNDTEFKNKIDDKTNELNNKITELDSLSNEIYNKYANVFDWINSFYEYIATKSNSFLKEQFSFDDNDLDILAQIRNKYDLKRQLLDKSINIGRVHSEKHPLDNAINEFNEALDKEILDEIKNDNSKETDDLEKYVQVAKEQWLNHINKNE